MYFEINDMKKNKTKDAVETTQLCLLKTFILFTSNFDPIAILEYQTYKGKWRHGIDSCLVMI
jgi:hypothetical protein